MPLIAMTRPPSGTARLGDWMHTAFAPEIAEEKAHLDRLSGIGAAGEQVQEDPGLPGFDDEDEATVMEMSPFASGAAPLPAMDAMGVEVSVMVVVDHGAPMQRASSLPAPIRVVGSPTPAPDPFAPPAEAATNPQTHTPPYLQDEETEPPTQVYPSQAEPLPAPMLPAFGDVQAPPGPAPAQSMAPAAPPPRKSGRLVGCLVAFLLLAVLVGGTGIGFWFTGGDAVLRARFPQLDELLGEP